MKTIRIPNLLAHLSELLNCASTDDIRPNMNGIYIHQTNGRINLVATDAHQLCELSYEVDLNAGALSTGCAEDFKLFIPSEIAKRAVKELKGSAVFGGFGAIELTNEPATYTFPNHSAVRDGVKARLLTKDFEFCSVTDFRFPNYEAVIPEDYEAIHLVLKSSDVETAYRLVKATKPSHNACVFELTPDQELVRITPIDYGDLPCGFSFEIPRLGNHSSKLKFGFNLDQVSGIIKALGATKHDHIIFKLRAHEDLSKGISVVCTTNQKSSWCRKRAVIMPVQLNPSRYL